MLIANVLKHSPGLFFLSGCSIAMISKKTHSFLAQEDTLLVGQVIEITENEDFSSKMM